MIRDSGLLFWATLYILVGVEIFATDDTFISVSASCL